MTLTALCPQRAGFFAYRRDTRRIITRDHPRRIRIDRRSSVSQRGSGVSAGSGGCHCSDAARATFGPIVVRRDRSPIRRIQAAHLATRSEDAVDHP
jgi:hypothetical protein